jgi:urease accessory protein
LNITRIRLFHLISPSLPTGAFAYSQGLEWAIDSGLVQRRQDLRDWLSSLLFNSIMELEVPVFRRLYDDYLTSDLDSFDKWCRFLVACRETREFREEERNRGRAIAKFVKDIDSTIADRWVVAAQPSQLAGFALISAHWKIDLPGAALGYTYSWLENLVMAAIKLIPLGQTSGHQVIADLRDECASAVSRGLELHDADIGGSCPAAAICSCLHETQYTRIFRS